LSNLIPFIEGLHISGIVCPGNALHVCHAGEVGIRTQQLQSERKCSPYSPEIELLCIPDLILKLYVFMLFLKYLNLYLSIGLSRRSEFTTGF
jgi:hypothetical protein